MDVGIKKRKKKKKEKPVYLSDLDKNPLYILSNYMSLDASKYSLNNIAKSISDHAGGRSYNRKNIVFVDKQNIKKVEERAYSRSKTYWKNMSYDENYVNILQALKNQNQKSKFIIYTTPLSKPFLRVLYKDKKLKEYYFRWIKDMIFVFDKVYFFTLPNKLSENYTVLSKDGDHFYPEAVGNISKNNFRAKRYKGFRHYNNKRQCG